MRVNSQKGYYFQRGVEFLGHWVSKGGVTVMPNKMEKIQGLERPSDVKGCNGVATTAMGPKHGNADDLSRAKVQEDMMSCGINDKIECAFRAEVEDDPHYRSIINYL